MIQIHRVGLIARRELIATVGRKGFLIGLLLMPALVLALVYVAPKILASRTPPVHGEVTVIDGSRLLVAPLRAAMDPGAIEARRVAGRRQSAEQGGAGFGQPPPPDLGPPAPTLTLRERPADAMLQEEKAWLAGQQGQAGSAGELRRLALIVIHPDAVLRAAGQPDYGSYDLYVAATLDDATESVLHESLRLALVRARLEAGGFDPQAVDASMRVQRPNAVIVAADGEKQGRRGLNRLLPFILGALMFGGVIMGGQTLMTSTIEEKSSRVVEVLLAAVSPLELMWGKLLGQMGVGLLVMGVYIGLGLLALLQFAMLGLLDPMLIVYLIVFFLISYLVFGALMMAIGAAVNQIADAQSLMGPIMLLLIAPYAMAPVIGRAPNALFSIVASFIPPVNSFVMLARLASDSPPPAWQAWASALIGVGAACIAVWFAAKIFKIGLLMHGKPPSFAALLRWARRA